MLVRLTTARGGPTSASTAITHGNQNRQTWRRKPGRRLRQKTALDQILFLQRLLLLASFKSTFIKIKINLSLAKKHKVEKQNETSNTRAWNGCVTTMKCTFAPLQMNGKVKITASGAAKPDNCRKSYSEWIWKCEEPAGVQQQDRIGLFVSVRGVFIEQV